MWGRQLARKVEAVNPTKEPLKSDLLNGKWELIYTTSASILQAKVLLLLLCLCWFIFWGLGVSFSLIYNVNRNQSS